MQKCTCVVCGRKFEASHKSMCCPNCKTRTCVICGKEFELKHPYTAVTCSKKCTGEYRKRTGVAKSGARKAKQTLETKYGVKNASELQKFKKICKWCGKEFETTSARQLYCGDDYGPCPVCGKPVKIKDMSVGPTTCSQECESKLRASTNLFKYGAANILASDYGKQKSKDTMLAHYGVDHYSKTQEYRDKYEATMNSRYGVSYPLQSESIKESWKATNLSKYGTEISLHSDGVWEKAKATVESNGGFGLARPELRENYKQRSLEKYGVDNPMKSEEVKNKAKQTSLRKYGTLYPTSKGSIVREKIKRTNLEKYGVDNYFSTQESLEHRKKTWINKYGVDNPSRSKKVQQRIKDHFIDEYGVDNPMKVPEIKQKAINTNLRRYTSPWWGSSEIGIKSRMLDSSKYEEFVQFRDHTSDYLSKFENKPTYHQLASKLGIDIATVSKYVLESGCEDLILYRKSSMEQDIYDFIKSLDGSITIRRNDREIISPQEIDLYLPDYKFGIECNPTYTHNSSKATHWTDSVVPRTYHRDKTKLADTKGIQLLHVFGYQWTMCPEIVKSMIRNKLGCSDKKYYARKLVVRNVPFNESLLFLESNHIQGPTSSKIRIGLYDGDELVSLMTFSKLRYSLGYQRSSVSDSWELTRFCTKLNCSCIGGASKLLKYFLKTYHPNKVVSFSALSYSTGRLYETLGFNKISVSDPGYVWVNLKTDIALNRVMCQKRNLRKLFNDPSIDIEHKTEKQIMEEHGFVQVFDSGVVRWEYVK